jgi:hypothetical protein
MLAARNAWPSFAFAARRGWPFVLLAVCAAIFAWRVDGAIRLYEPIPTWTFLRRPVELLVIAAVVFGAGLVLARRFWAHAGEVSAWRSAAVAGAVALVAATPVGFTYNDGCNDNTTQTAIALIPGTAIVRPENAALSYDGLTTEMACFDGRESKGTRLAAQRPRLVREPPRGSPRADRPARRTGTGALTDRTGSVAHR